MAVVALHYRPVPTNYVTLLMKQFTIRGSMEYPERFEDAIELLARRDLSCLITHTLPLEEFGAGLAVLEGSKDCGKVMITMEGGSSDATGVTSTSPARRCSSPAGRAGSATRSPPRSRRPGASVTVTGTRAPRRPTTTTDCSRVHVPAARDARRARRSTRSPPSFDALDVLVNNAGANFPDGLDEWDPDGVLGRARPQRRGRDAPHDPAAAARWRRARWPAARAS